MTAGPIADARVGREMDAQGRKGAQEVLREEFEYCRDVRD